METKITEVTIMPVRPQKGLVAIASCLLDEKVYLGSIGIYTKLGGGYRLSYPTKKVGANKWDIFRPINNEAGNAIEKAILEEYEKLITEGFEAMSETSEE